MAIQEANKLANQNTVKLAKATEEITKVIDSLKTTTILHEDLTYKIETQERALADLETRYQEAARAKQVAMDLDFREREANKVAEVLKTHGKVAVVGTEYQTMLTDYQNLKTEFARKLEEEAAKIRQSEAAKTGAAIKQAQLELQVKEANNNATITALTDKAALLATQVEDYKRQVADERQARISEAQARGTPMVTVNSGK